MSLRESFNEWVEKAFPNVTPESEFHRKLLDCYISGAEAFLRGVTNGRTKNK